MPFDVHIMIRTRELATRIKNEASLPKDGYELKKAWRSPSWMYFDQDKAEQEVYLYNIDATFKSKYAADKFAKRHETSVHKSYWAAKYNECPYKIYIPKE